MLGHVTTEKCRKGPITAKYLVIEIGMPERVLMLSVVLQRSNVVVVNEHVVQILFCKWRPRDTTAVTW